MSHHGGKHMPKTKQIRKERHARALAVAEESGWSKLSLQEKLNRLPKEGCSRQRARYTKMLEAQQKGKSVDSNKKNQSEQE